MIYFNVLVLNAFVLLLMPILGIQAIWVRKKALRLPEPEGQREYDFNTDLLHCTDSMAKRTLMIVGDSAAAGVGAKSQDEALSGRISHLAPKGLLSRMSLHATTGLTSGDVVNLLTQIPAKSYCTALVSMGVNDVTKFVSLNAWRINIESVASLLKHKFNCQSIIFTALPPMHLFPVIPQPLRTILGIRAYLFNKVLQRYIAKSDSAQILRINIMEQGSAARSMKDSGLMAEDGFHPSSKGYAVWANQVVQLIIKDESGA